MVMGHVGVVMVMGNVLCTKYKGSHGNGLCYVYHM